VKEWLDAIDHEVQKIDEGVDEVRTRNAEDILILDQDRRIHWGIDRRWHEKMNRFLA
jgi:hypothetical protein